MKRILVIMVVFLVVACDSRGQNAAEDDKELTMEELLTLGPWHRDLDGNIMPLDKDGAWTRIEFTADSVFYYNAPNTLASVGSWELLETLTCGSFAEAVSAESDIGLPGVNPLGKCPDILVKVAGTLPVDVIIFELTRSRMRFAGFFIDRGATPADDRTFPYYALTYTR